MKAEHQSAKPCGCDPGAHWLCEVHQREKDLNEFMAHEDEKAKQAERDTRLNKLMMQTPAQQGDWFDKPTEVRHTSDTGGAKGRKLARFSLTPWDAVWAVSEHFGIGANKYEERNWENGYPWSWTFDALMRHLTAWWQGEDRDAETGSLHVVAVAWHALVLVAFQLRSAGVDDRPTFTRKKAA